MNLQKIKEVLSVLLMILLVILGESWMLILIATFGVIRSIVLLTIILFFLTWLVGTGKFKPRQNKLSNWAEKHVGQSMIGIFLINIVIGPLMTVMLVKKFTEIKLNYKYYLLLSLMFSFIWIVFYNSITGGEINGIFSTFL